MNTIDDEELLDRIREVYAGQTLRVPLSTVMGTRRATRRRGLVAATACAGVAVVVGALVLNQGGAEQVAGRPLPAGERCAAKVLEITRDALTLPDAERGQVPTTQLDIEVGTDEVLLYATRHALITCVARPGRAEVHMWVVPDGEPLPWNKLEPHTWGVDERLSWVGGTAPDGTQQIEAELPSGRKVAGVAHDGVFLVAWPGEAAEPVRIRATLTEGGVITWGPPN
ncbi:MAG: hypothetical protein ACM30G_05170 [Micromonosporaceae bacterium]